FEADHDASAATAKNAATKYKPVRNVASARHVINASNANNTPKSTYGDETACSIRATIGKKNRSAGAVYVAFAPTPANGLRTRNAMASPSAYSATSAATPIVARVQPALE